MSEPDFSNLLRSHGADQAEASARDLAHVIGGFRKELIGEGFDKDECWELCREFFLAMIGVEPGGDDE